MPYSSESENFCKKKKERKKKRELKKKNLGKEKNRFKLNQQQNPSF